MILSFTKSFKKKAEIQNYPMIGFWIQNCHKSPDEFNFKYTLQDGRVTDFHNYPEVAANYQEYKVVSNYIRTNTFIDDSKVTISFQSSDIIQNKEYENNKFRYFYLYCVDYFEYINNQYIFDNLHLEDINKLDYTKLLLLNQLAGFIYFEPDEDIKIKQLINNIIHFNKPSWMKCSIEPLSEYNQPQVDHYNALDIGQVNYYESTESSTMIDYNSGIDYVKNTIHYLNPLLLDGSMTIHKSGVIQL